MTDISLNRALTVIDRASNPLSDKKRKGMGDGRISQDDLTFFVDADLKNTGEFQKKFPKAATNLQEALAKVEDFFGDHDGKLTLQEITQITNPKSVLHRRSFSTLLKRIVYVIQDAEPVDAYQCRGHIGRSINDFYKVICLKKAKGSCETSELVDRSLQAMGNDPGIKLLQGIRLIVGDLVPEDAYIARGNITDLARAGFLLSKL